jgi:hypothetical protein
MNADQQIQQGISAAVSTNPSDLHSSASSAANILLPDVVFLIDGEPRAWMRSETIAREPAPAVDVAGERLTIRPLADGPFPATVRWRYGIGCISGAP